jgi:hypothetical protein
MRSFGEKIGKSVKIGITRNSQDFAAKANLATKKIAKQGLA